MVLKPFPEVRAFIVQEEGDRLTIICGRCGLQDTVDTTGPKFLDIYTAEDVLGDFILDHLHPKGGT